MCQLGYVVKSVVIPKDKPVVLYRWFKIRNDYKRKEVFKSRSAKKIVDFNRVHIRSLTDRGGRNIWMKETVRSDKEPAMYENHGLYGYSSKSAALADPPINSDRYVLAKIRVWGKCIKHTNGMRAHYAKIEAFYPDSMHGNQDLVVENKQETYYYPYKGKVWVYQKETFTFKEVVAHNKFLKTIPIRKLRK